MHEHLLDAAPIIITLVALLVGFVFISRKGGRTDDRKHERRQLDAAALREARLARFYCIPPSVENLSSGTPGSQPFEAPSGMTPSANAVANEAEHVMRSADSDSTRPAPTMSAPQEVLATSGTALEQAAASLPGIPDPSTSRATAGPCERGNTAQAGALGVSTSAKCKSQSMPISVLSPPLTPTNGVPEEMVVADTRLTYRELERLDSAVEILIFKAGTVEWQSTSSPSLPDNFVQIDQQTFNRHGLEHAFAAVPLQHEALELFVPSHHSNRDDGAKFMSVPQPGAYIRLGRPRPLVLMAENWWNGLRESIYAATRTAPPGRELFKHALLRTFVLPVANEPEQRRVLITTNFAGTDLEKLHGEKRWHLFERALQNAAVTPPIGEWPKSTAHVSDPDRVATEGVRSADDFHTINYRGHPNGQWELFPHQVRTVAWMRTVEARNDIQRVLPLPRLAVTGIATNPTEKAAEMPRIILPSGGVVGHPVGSGKTKIVLQLVVEDRGTLDPTERCQEGTAAKTLILCPPHLTEQWNNEAAEILGAADMIVVAGFDKVSANAGERWRRLVVDEPQDMSPEEVAATSSLEACFRWVLCGTARQQLRRCATVVFKSELPSWKVGGPLTHGSHLRPPILAMVSIPVWERLAAGFVAHCCLADAPGECLPMPSLHVHIREVHLPAEEAVVVQMHTRAHNLQLAVRAACGIGLNPSYAGEEGMQVVERDYREQLNGLLRQRDEIKEAGGLLHADLLASIGLTCTCSPEHGPWRCAQQIQPPEGVEPGRLDAMDKALDPLRKGLSEVEADLESKERLLRFAADARGMLDNPDSSCDICFQSLWGRPVSLWPSCMHLFCSGCVNRMHDVGRSTVRCPNCRSEERRANILTFAPRGSQHEANGKMPHLVDLVSGLLDENDAHIVVFAQWTGILEKTIDALLSAGISALTLCNTTLERRLDALRRFGRVGEPRVLLLSSEAHASGINLQVARHVIMMHPYCPEQHLMDGRLRDRCMEQVRAYEQQAIGRVRRYPQNREVHLYRLFVAGTIEEELLAEQGLI